MDAPDISQPTYWWSPTYDEVPAPLCHRGADGSPDLDRCGWVTSQGRWLNGDTWSRVEEFVGGWAGASRDGHFVWVGTDGKVREAPVDPSHEITGPIGDSPVIEVAEDGDLTLVATNGTTVTLPPEIRLRSEDHPCTERSGFVFRRAVENSSMPSDVERSTLLSSSPEVMSISRTGLDRNAATMIVDLGKRRSTLKRQKPQLEGALGTAQRSASHHRLCPFATPRRNWSNRPGPEQRRTTRALRARLGALPQARAGRRQEWPGNRPSIVQASMQQQPRRRSAGSSPSTAT